jgi:eukaryotic-like serine/threonine-protein kinase
LGPRHPERLKAMSRLGGLLRREGKYAQAEAMQTECLDGMRQALGPEHPNTLTAAVNLALTEHYLHQDAKADELLRAALPVLEAKFGDTWQRYRCESILGAVLAAEGKKGEAGALLASGYQGMVERKKTIPADSLYSLEDAAKWKNQLRP